MGAVRAQITERQRAGGAPASPRPRGARGAPPGLAASSPGRPVVAPSRAGRRGRGPQRREHLQNKDSGLDRETTPPPPPSLPPPPPRAPARPTRTRLSRTPPERRSRGSTRAHKPSGAPGHHWARRPGAGGGTSLFKAPSHTKPTLTPRSLRILVFSLFFKQPELSFSHWEGGLAVPTLAAGGAGERALQVCAVNRCLFAVVAPTHHPPPPSTRVCFFFFPFFRQRSCYGLPGRLPWVTGRRPAGSLPATQSPPQPPPAERPGGRRRERACAGRGAGECARAAAAPQPTGGRGCSGGSATASGVGAKL